MLRSLNPFYYIFQLWWISILIIAGNFWGIKKKEYKGVQLLIDGIIDSGNR